MTDAEMMTALGDEARDTVDDIVDIFASTLSRGEQECLAQALRRLVALIFLAATELT
jgi:hypothetical protein